MGSKQKPGGRASALATSQRLLLVVVALALAAYAASTWYTRHMWSRVDDATDAFAAETVYGLANISATRETLWKVDSVLHREAQPSGDLDLKTQVDELRSELDVDGDRLVAERPERDDLGKAAADLRAVQSTLDRVQAAMTEGDRVEARRLIAVLDRSAHGVEELLDGAQEIARREAADFEAELARLRRRAGQIQRVFDVADGLLTLLVGLFAVRALRAGERVEGMARREAAKFQGVVSSAPDAIVSIDEHRQIVLFNESAERIFGWSSREALGKHFDILAPERLRATVRAQFDKLVGEDGEPRRALDTRGEVIGVRKSGEEFAAEVAVSMLEAEGPTLVTAIFRDVTERKRTDGALRASEARFHALVDASAEVLWTVGAEGQALEDCPSWRAYTGQSPEQYKGFGWLDVVHPDDRERVAEHWRSAARARSPFSVEYRVHHVRGEWRWVAERAVPLFGPDGTVIEWIGMNSDIHERKRVESAVRTSEERFRALVEASAQVVWTAAADGAIVEESPSWFAFTGQSHERARSFGWLDVVHPDDRERVAALWQKAIATTTRFEAEFRVLHASGEWRWVADRCTPLLQPSGAAREWIGMISDIHERTRIASEQRFLAELEPLLDSTLDYRERLTILARLLASHFGDCCSAWIAGNGDRPAQYKAFHASTDPPRGRVCDRLEPLWLEGGRAAPWRSPEPPQAMVLSHVSAQSLESAGLSEVHLRLLSELRPESMMILPLAVHGQLLGALFVASSNPHRRFGAPDLVFGQEIAAQASLSIENAQLYDRARQAIQARDDVLRVVAHDLRNPIAVIQLAANLLIREPSELGGGSRSTVQRILRSALRATRLIEDLLEVTRIEVGHLVLEHHSILAAEIVNDVAEAQGPLVSASSLELQIDVAGPIPAVWVDRDRLEQVFANLIGNAVNFTPAGGRITIGAAPTEGGAVQFWVTDTGAGFDAESREHLFDRFWQAGKGAHHGVGLGLSIVKSIVEAHGGRVSVEGAPGLGSTFSFTIPAATAQQHGPSETVQAQ
jgi:PAS domain S-box-containing protein